MMKNKNIDYSRIRGLLTMSIRYLQLLEVSLMKQEDKDDAISETDYFCATLELLRNCLYNCTNVYTGQIDLLEVIKDINSYFTSFVLTVKSFKTKEIQYIDKAWSICKQIEKELS